MITQKILRLLSAFTVILLSLAVFATVAAASPSQPWVLNARSSKLEVIDGDSINYGRHHFRLCGIQAPERQMFYYQQATHLLRGLVGRGRLTAYVVDIDKYGRRVAMFYAGNERVSVNEKMVKMGGAKHYRRFSDNCKKFVSPQHLARLETYARARRLGLWLRP